MQQPPENVLQILRVNFHALFPKRVQPDDGRVFN